MIEVRDAEGRVLFKMKGRKIIEGEENAKKIAPWITKYNEEDVVMMFWGNPYINVFKVNEDGEEVH